MKTYEYSGFIMFSVKVEAEDEESAEKLVSSKISALNDGTFDKLDADHIELESERKKS